MGDGCSRLSLFFFYKYSSTVNYQKTYVNLQGWMLDLNLNTTRELLAFAIIYGFSQDGANAYKATISYMEKWLNCSKPTVIATLDKLVKSDLVIKDKAPQGSRRPNTYSANLAKIEAILTGKETLPVQVKKFNPSGKETLPVQVKKFNLTGKETLPYNIIDNKEDNKEEVKAHAQTSSSEIDYTDAEAYMQVATLLANHYRNEGKGTWAYMTDRISPKPSPEDVAKEWASKHCDSPMMLRDWKRQAPKLSNWAKNVAKSAASNPNPTVLPSAPKSLPQRTQARPDVNLFTAKKLGK